MWLVDSAAEYLSPRSGIPGSRRTHPQLAQVKPMLFWLYPPTSGYDGSYCSTSSVLPKRGTLSFTPKREARKPPW